MAKKAKAVPVQTWEVFVYRKHESGIGEHYVRTEIVTVRPTYDTHWFDCTNGRWARTL